MKNLYKHINLELADDVGSRKRHAITRLGPRVVRFSLSLSITYKGTKPEANLDRTEVGR